MKTILGAKYFFHESFTSLRMISGIEAGICMSPSTYLEQMFVKSSGVGEECSREDDEGNRWHEAAETEAGVFHWTARERLSDISVGIFFPSTCQESVPMCDRLSIPLKPETQRRLLRRWNGREVCQAGWWVNWVRTAWLFWTDVEGQGRATKTWKNQERRRGLDKAKTAVRSLSFASQKIVLSLLYFWSFLF